MLTYDHNTCTVTINLDSIRLSDLESRLMNLLYTRPGHVVSVDDIGLTIYGDSWLLNGQPNISALEKLISRLRKKIGSRYIQTIKRAGYYFQQQPSPTGTIAATLTPAEAEIIQFYRSLQPTDQVTESAKWYIIRQELGESVAEMRMQ